MTARVRINATPRRLFVVLGSLALVLAAAVVYVQIASANVTVTAATGGTSISADKAANAASPAYTALGNIVITEGANGDFASPQTNTTLILTAPANWEFQSGTCTSTFVASNNITAASCANTTSAITVTLSVSGTNKGDTLTISNVNVRPTSGGGSMASVNILRTAGSPGTATIAGIVNGTTNFGTLSMVAGALNKLQVLLPGESNAPGAPASSGSSGSPTAQTAATAFNVTVNAVDQFWNLKNAVTDTVHLTSNDSNPTLAADAALVAGTKTMSVTLRQARATETVTASDVTNGAITAHTSSNLTVNPGAFTKLQLLMPGETAAPGTASGKTGSPSAQTAGTAFNVTANAVDANWNVVSSTDTVGITSSATATYATLPANAAMVAGTKTFSVTLNKVGSFTTTATDITNGAMTANTSPAITVNVGAFAKLQLLMPGETADPGSATGKTGAPTARTAGSSFAVTVNAVDANWNLVNTAVDTGAISSSDANFAPPANAALIAGTKSFTVSMPTAGSFTLTSTDASDGSKTANTSPATTVNAGVFAKLQLLMPGETAAPGSVSGKTGTPSARTAGTSFSVTVNAVDANWNPVSSTDTVGITSSDTYAVLPANAAMVAGTKTFTVTLKTAGSKTVTATDITNGAMTANTSPATTVNAGAFTKLQLLMPGETADPGSATGKTGTPSSRTAGTAFSVTVNAVDANWNLVSSTDTVGITSSATSTYATLPANAALVAGTQTFNVTLNKVGSFTTTATDITNGAMTANTSPATTVNVGAFAKLQLLLPGETADPGSATGKTGTPSAQTAGSSFSVTVNAVDANWNLVSSTDTVGITSSDTYAVLPANAAMVAGTKTFTVTLKTAGSKTVTATDITNGAMTANTSPATTVNAGAFTKLQLLMPGETADPGSATGKTGTPSAQTAGSSFSVTVNAVDANWNLVSSTDTVGITSSATATYATLPANAALVAGTKNFTVTLNKVGSFTTTATDITNGAMTANTSPATTVNVGALNKLQLLMPGETADPGSATGKTGTPSAQTAGSSFSVTVNAVDANWNLVSSTDTAGITSSDANATLPANAALVAGTKTFTVTLKTAGSKTVTATDISNGAITANTSPATTVNAGALNKLQLLLPGETASPGSASGKTGTPSTQTAGSSFSVTVNAVDANWNLVSSTDTAGITSSDANATLPANAALVAGTKTFSITAKTAGSSTFTATDISNGAITANTSPATTVNAGALNKLQLLMPGETAAPGAASGKTGTPSAQTAGSSFSVTVNAVDANWNLVSSTDTAGITSTDANATLPANAALVAGTKNFTVTLKTAGSKTVTATDISNGAITLNTSPATTVNAGALNKFQLLLPGETAAPGTASGKTGTPSAQTAGSSFSVTVNAVDANWNLVSSADTAAISSSDPNFAPPSNAALIAGTKNFTVSMPTAGSFTLTASDASNGAITANTSPATTVNAGALNKLQLLLPGETANPGSASGKTGTPSAQTAGSSFSVTVNAVDANWNLVSSTDTAGITSSDANATLPANAALVAGTKTFSITAKTAGSSTFTATDISNGAITANTSPATTVNAGALNKLQLLMPGETAAPGAASGKTGTPSAQTAGSSFSVTVNAVDANWNLVSSTDTAGITSSDANATLPANAALVAGTKSFTVTLKTAGSKTVTATDISNGAITANTSPATTVNAGTFAKLQLLMPGETASPGSASGKTGTPSAQTAGSSFSATVNAVDANWNPVSATDTIAITSSDSNATLPANAALVAGTKTFTVTMNTAGSFTVTATDSSDGSKTANTSPATTVNAGAFAKLQLLMPGETAAPGTASGKTGTPSARTAGSSFSVTVNAVDANWNPVSSTDTVAITSSDANATLPANAAMVAGTKNFTVTMNTAGSKTVTATDASDGSKTANTSPATTVNAGAFAKLQLLMPGETAAPGTASGKTGTPSARTAGGSFSVTVNAVDANWNPVSATDTIAITSSDANATLPANAALVAGTKNFTVTLNTAGSFTVTATDASDGSKAPNTSPATTVNAGAFAKLQLLVPGETAAPGTASGKTGTPSARTAGGSFSVTANAVDANWNPVSSTDNVAITSSDANATVPANAALVAGTKNFTVTLNTAGSFTVTATDSSDGSKTANTSPATTVNAGAFAKLQLLLPGETAAPGTASGKTGTPSARTAGSSFSVTVNAVDANWNPVSSTDNVAITSSDANAGLPANAALVAGTKTFTVTLNTAGAKTVTATDATDGSKTANTSPSTTVNVGAFAKLQILVPGETADPGSATGKTGTSSAQTAGSGFTATVRAVDANWNLVNSVTDTVAISSSDANAAPPANAALVGGTKNFTVSLPTAGSNSVTASDATDGSKTADTSPLISVGVGAFAKLQLLVPGESASPGSVSGKTGSPTARTAGSSFSVTVNAVDANWNPVTSTDTVAISSSDANATLPANAALVAGTKNFNVTLKTAGSKTVTATDATDGAKSPDTSPSITVNAGAFAKLQILAPGETTAPGTATGKTGSPSAQTAGSAYTVTVNAVDANWNPVSSTDTIAISSSDANATLPANAALVAGTKNFNVTPKTAGSKTVTATDATDGAKSPDTTSATTINAAAFAKLQLLMPGETADPGSATGKTGSPTARTAGGSFSVTVNAVDANWNPVSSTDTVAISSSDANAALPANAALVAGTKNFNVTLKTAGTKTVTATDATDGAKSPDTSPSTTVNAGAFTKLQILAPGETAAPGTATGKTGSPSAQTAGSAYTLTVNAVDANWNPVSSTDTVAITSSDANATLPANAALVAGTKTFNVTLKTAGTKTVTATDVTDGAKSPDTSTGTTINAAGFAKLQLLMPGETAAPGTATGKTGSPTAETAGSFFTVTVNAVDANWNAVSSTDTVAISSSDANAILPANAALVGGTKNFNVTFKTAGSKTVTATDLTDGAKSPDTSPSTTVNAGSFAKLQLLVPGESAAPGTATGKTGSASTQNGATSFSVTVNAVDANWNPVSSTDTVAITSSDGAANLPANAALVAGTKNFNVTLNTIGSKTVTATDSTDGAKSPDTSPSITVVDVLPPLFVSASVDGSTLTITFNEPLGASTPAGSAFTVVRNGVTMAAPTNVVVSGSTVTLTLAAATHNADVVTVAYTQPGSNRLQDVSGNEAATFGAQTVANGTVSAAPDVPALTAPGDATTVATLTPALHATFSDPDTNNTGQITFRVCSNSDCSSVLGATFATATGLANGADGTMAVPAGRITTDGTYYWQAKATDDTAASSAFSASRSFVVDTTAPVLQTAAVNGTSLALTYGESLDGASVPAALAYGLHVNSGSAVTPTNVSVSGTGVTLTFAAGTVHNGDAVTLDYTAGANPVRDAAGNASANLSGTAVTNNTASLAPSVPALTAPTAAARVATLTPSLSATFSDADVNNTGQITFKVCTDASCTSSLGTFTSAAGVVNGTDGSANVPGGTITADGTYYWQAKATDNTSAASAYSTTRSFIVDTTGPSLASAAVDGTSLVLTFDEPLNTGSTPAGSAFVVRQNGTPLANPTGVVVSGSTVTLTLASSVHNDDTVTVAYTQPGSNGIKDVVSNDAPSFTAQPVTNNTASIAPDVPTLVLPADAASLATLTPSLRASFSDTDVNNTGQITFRVCTVSNCSSVLSTFTSATGITNGANATVSVPGGDITSDGTYYWQAKATDNHSVASSFSSSRSFTLDTTAPPVPTVDSGPLNASTSGKDVTFTYSDTEGGVTLETQIDGLGWNANASPKSYTNLSDGSHTFEVRAKDALGNTSSPRTRTWTVDAIAPPSATIDSGPAASSTSGKNVTFGFSDAEGGVTFEVQLDGGGFASDSSPKAYTNLSDGSHTFQVRALDAYGNVSGITSRTWTVDAIAPPSPTIDSGPAAASTTGNSVSFGYSDTEGTATLEVQIDGGGYVTAASPKAYTGLSDGSHTFSVRAFDAYGNTSAATSRTWTVDAVAPPQPTIDTGPAAASTSGKDVLFTFSDTEGTATFEVQIDGGGYTSSTSPKAYTNLSDGSHTFQVRALDGYGNTSSAASRTWTVDAVAPPVPSIDSGPAAASTTGKNVSFGFSDTEGTATFEVQIDGGGYTSSTSPKAYTNLSDGSHTFNVRSLDAYGNTSASLTRTWTVDAVAPPVPSIDSGPAAASTSGKNVSFGFSDTEGTATFEVQIDGGGYTSASSPKAYTNLSDGSHTFNVRALDAYGNTSAALTRTWTVDAVAPPAPSIDSGPAAASTSGTSVSFGFSDTEGTATFEVQIDSSGYLASASPVAYNNLSDGSHTFFVRALDGYGNVSSVTSRTWTVDAVAPPAPTIDSGPAAASTTGKNVSFGFSDTEGTATFEVQIDGGGYASSTSPKAYTNLSDGSHTFQVRALDPYGNVSSVTSRTWTVDAIAPPVPSIDSGPAAASTSGKNVSFGFSDTEGTATFEVQIDGGGYTSSTSPKVYTNLSDGSHTFAVRALDAYGNTSSSATRTWTVDAVAPPAPSIDSGPAAASTTGKSVSFGFSDTEGTATFEIQIDGSGYVASPSPVSFNNLTDGSHTFAVRALDAYGNTSTATSRTWTVDAVAPPAPSIDTGPAAASTTGAGVSFGFSDTEGTATFEVQIDGGGYNASASPKVYTNLADGSHTFQVHALDAYGNVSGATSRTWTVDVVAPPTPTIDSGPAAASTSGKNVSFGFSDTEGTATFEVQIDGGGYNASASPKAYTNLSDGSHTFSVRALDAYGNTSSATSRTWTVDAVAPPVPSIDSGPAAASTSGKNPSFGFSDTEGSATFEVQIDGGGYTTSGSPKAYTNLSDGSHTFSVRALDAYGNTSSATSLTWTVDAVAPPVPSIDSGPAGSSTSGKNVSFGFSDTEGTATFEVQIDGGGYASSTSPKAYTNLADGSHTFAVRALDGYGNTSASISRTWTVDAVAPPTPSIDSGPAGSSTSGKNVSFGFSDTEGTATLEVQIDGGGYASSTSPKAYTNLSDGSHTFAVRALDAYGNTSSATSRTWTVDAVAPPVPTIDSGPAAASTTGKTVSFGFSDTEGTATFEVQIDGGGYTSSASPKSYTNLTQGSHTFHVRASDAYGNTSSSLARTWTVDANDPTGTQDDPGAYLRGTISLTGSAADTGGSGVASVAFQRSPAGGGAWTTVGTDTTAPYSTSFDTTTAATPDGLYDLRLLVTDGAGNTATSAVITGRRIDNTVPLGTLSDPGPYLRLTVTLGSSSSDAGSGVASTIYAWSPAGQGTWTTTPAAFDTTTGATPDGLYDLRLLVTDNAGNQTVDTIANRRIDNTPPSASMANPGTYLSGTVNFASTSSDPGGSGVATVAFEKSLAGAGTYSSVPATWNTTPADDGLYDFRIVVTDNAGNVATSAPQTNVRVDNIAPAVSITSPVASSNVTGTVTITPNATDTGGSGIDTVTFAYAVHGSGSWTATPAAWNTTVLADGLYDLRATATDRAGNSTTSATVANVTADNSAPLVAFTAPTDTDFVNAAAADPKTLTANATDAASGVAGVEFFTCSISTVNCVAGTWTSLGAPDTTAPYTASWNIPLDGNRALKVVATDNVGKTSSNVINVTVDRTAPDTTILTKPANPSNVAAPNFTFSANEGGSTFECKLDSGSWTPCTTPNTLPTLTDGTHTFSIRATDPAGNTDTSAATWTWLADLTAPTGTLANPGANVRGTVTLLGTSSDPGGANASGVASLAYQYSTDGSTWATTPAAWDTVGPPAVDDGVYQVHIVVTDNAGNVFTSPAITNVRVDNTVPTTSIDDPGANLRGTKILTAAASDTGSGVAQVDFQASAVGLGAWASVGIAAIAPYGVSLDTLTLTDGLYDFRTVATDVAGNVTYGTPVTNRRVDNTPPTASIASPGSPLRGSVTLGSTTADTGGSGVASVLYEASRNAGPYAAVSSPWNTVGSADGTYSLRVVATDVAGNQTVSAPVNGIVVDNTAPVTTDNAPAGWRNSAVTVTLSASDAGSGVSTTKYSLDGGVWTTGTSVNVPAVDGAHSIAYYSVDTAGNIESQKSTTVLIQASGPTCPTCSAGDYLRGTVTLNANPQTTGAPIVSVAFRHDGTTISTDLTAPYSANWDTTSVSDGVYDLDVVVTDSATNTSTIDFGNKVVDNTLPTAAVGGPLAGAVVSGTVSVSASATDAHLATIDYFVNGSQIGSTTGGPVSWNTIATVSDGIATLTVVATDRSGNSRTSAPVSVTVDNEAPTISLTAPANAKGTTTLSATTSADTVTVEFQRRTGAGLWTPINTVNGGPFQTSFDTTTVTDGTYSLRAIATDPANHTTATAAQPIVIDNTAPTGSIATPIAGATVGGTVSLTATANDPTSGVDTVTYAVRSTGAVAFTNVGSASSAPWAVNWATAGLATGSYDLRITVADRAGNTFQTAPITIFVDATPPGVELQPLGSTLSGTITLNATTTGQGVVRVNFGYSEAGSGRWVVFTTAANAPYAASLDTTALADGPYEFRAVVEDAHGNSSASTRSAVVDNHAPELVSSVPEDGAIVPAADSIDLLANEALSAIRNPAIDGNSAPAPVISGRHAVFNLGPLGLGLHALSGSLVDASGKTTPFIIHVTVQPAGTPASAQAPVEKNTSADKSTTITTAGGGISVTMRAGSWPSGGNSNDWVILRIDPAAATDLGMTGFVSLSPIFDVTARWALQGDHLHTGFGRELVLEIPDATGKGLPATKDDNGKWRLIPPLPANADGRLPASFEDAFYRDNGFVEILSKHLTPFTLVKDVMAPTAAKELSGSFNADGLTVHWTPGNDNSGSLGPAVLYAGDQRVATVAAGQTSALAGPVKAGDPRAFRIVQTDPSGNTSAPSRALRILPDLTGMTDTQARAALEQLGFVIGSIRLTTAPTVPPGTVVAPSGLSAAVEGSTVNLFIASAGAQTKLAFSVVGTKTVRASSGGHIAVRVNVTKRSTVVATLYNPRAQKKVLKLWNFSVQAGVTIMQLKLPPTANKPGHYRLVWIARASREQISRTLIVQVVGAAKPAVKVNQPIQVVLVGGASIRNGLAAGLRSINGRVLSTTDENATFLLAGNTDLNIQAIVVDADRYTLSFVHDLRTVFPNVPIVALTDDPLKLSRSIAAGATVALTHSTPPDQVAKVVRRLISK